MGLPQNIVIRSYKPGDDEGIVKVLRKTFPKWDTAIEPLKLWRWKYAESPHQNQITVITADGKIIGCDHHKIFNAKIGPEVTTLSWGDDLAIDAEYRGLGLWAKMDDFQKIDSSFKTKYRYSTTTNPIVIRDNAKKNKKKFPSPVTRMVKINDIDYHLRMRPMKNSLLVKSGYQSLKIVNKIKGNNQKIRHYDDFKVEMIKVFDEKIDSFWERIKEDYDFILEKKSGSLNWRFKKPVRGEHTFIQAKNGEDVLGFLVVGLREEEEYTEARIEDLLALNNRLDVADALLKYALRYLGELGINAVYYQVVEGHPYQEVSKNCGFIDSGSQPNIYLDYSRDYQRETNETEIHSLEESTPGRLYFNYSDTI